MILENTFPGLNPTSATRAAALALAALTMLATPASAATGLGRLKSGPIAISQDGASVWVVNPDANSVTRIAAGPDTTVAEIPVGVEPRNLAIAPSGSEVWVTNFQSNTVSVIGTASNSVVATLPTLLGPFGVLITPDGAKAHVTCQLSDSLLTFDVSSRSVIDRKVTGRRPRAMAMTPDGNRLMVQQFTSEWKQMLTSFYDGGGSLSAAPLLLVGPVPQGDGGYPGANDAIAVGPGDTTLWVPLLDVNPLNGPIRYPGTGRLTLNSTMQAVVREIRISGRVEIAENPTGGRRRLNSAGAKVQMPADVAFTADGAHAYIPCSFSNDVLKIETATNPPTTLLEIPVGDYPNGIVLSPMSHRAYVSNFLSRSVSVINTLTDSVIGSIATTEETLPPSLLNGKKLFNTSTGRMSTDARISCAGCHPDGGTEGATWDFSQFGTGNRNTRSPRGWSNMPHLLAAGNWDEVQDAEFTIQNVQFGQGLADGPDNAPVGPSNAGRSQDLDDLAAYVSSLAIRNESPARNSGDQSLSPAAAAGRALFDSKEVGCRACHPEPLFTDKIRHDVGTYLPSDTSGYLGFATPTLCGIHETDAYLHAGQARYLQSVVTGLNDYDEHGRTTQLSTAQRNDLIAYLKSIIPGKEDVTPPRIEFARAVDVTEIVVRFLEPVDPVSASDIANYAIDNGVSVLSASLDPFSTYMGRDGLTVHLFTSPHAPGPLHTVTVRGVRDLSMNANAIPPVGHAASYSYAPQASFTFSNVDSIHTSRLGRDTDIDAGNPTWNLGRSGEIRVGANGSARRAMVMFDFYPMLSTVVADSSEIVSATIRLRLKGQAASTPVRIDAYRLLKYFVEGSGGEVVGQPFPGQANWNSAREGRLAWGSPGASLSGPGVEGDATSDYVAANDRAFTPDAFADVSTVGETYEWDVTHSIRWAFARPHYWNFGHLFVAASEEPGTEKVFHSLEDTVEAYRPQLVITVRADNAVGVPFDETRAIAGYSLAPVGPNPTRGQATFALSIPKDEWVTLKLFDVTGRAVRTLADERLRSGIHRIAWDGRNGGGDEVASGIYFYRIKAGRLSQVGRLVVVR